MRASGEFRDTLRHGVRAARPTLVLHAQQLTSPPSRVGFVVSRAVGGAVVRNRVKRRLRHLAAEHLDETVPMAIVVRALPAASQQPERLGDDLAGAWTTVQRRLQARVAS